MNQQELESSDVPEGSLAGFKRYWKADLVSGFLVFLIALPLCLGISVASGFPAAAGILTAIVGGIFCGFVSNSELTIKGPAAGLIVIVLGCVTEFGFTTGQDPAADLQAYRLALGVGVAAGVIQILVGLFRAGVLAEFFPSAAVHGLLAAIGVIILLKQFPVMLGLSSSGTPFELVAKIPDFVTGMNPIIGGIGLASLAIVFLHRFLPERVKAIPGPLMVLIFAVPAGLLLGIHETEPYEFAGKTFALGPSFLVDVPLQIGNALAFPDFSGLTTPTGLKYIALFAIIGSLESLLSAKAVEEIDPWHRKTNHNRDLTAVGIGNTIAAAIGGLPMIAEIVRSRANIDNGAHTRFANMFHGMFLLVLIAAVPARRRRSSSTCTNKGSGPSSSSSRRSSACWRPTSWSGSGSVWRYSSSSCSQVAFPSRRSSACALDSSRTRPNARRSRLRMPPCSARGSRCASRSCHSRESSR
ncbi:MAG: SulP family inorganic anion transporter [Planctomycetota bacterium]|jgi:MFS superfamily sulfate permease-like transporter